MELCHGLGTDLEMDHGVIMDVEIAWCCGRKQADDDNAWASLKALRDGIADVLCNGEDRVITQGNLTQTRGEGVVTVTLRMEGKKWSEET